MEYIPTSGRRRDPKYKSAEHVGSALLYRMVSSVALSELDLSKSKFTGRTLSVPYGSTSYHPMMVQVGKN